MEAAWQADRSLLRDLLRTRASPVPQTDCGPDRPLLQLGQEMGQASGSSAS